ncbi:MAG: metallophosphoesterase [Eggerthellaceae bacterium]|nr:metallophosphoesterase [Eggerthellaceae bacterium]
MTKSLTFLHVADIHFGAPFRGFRALTDAWKERLGQAIGESYDRVIDAAIAHRVEFVALAGDVFDTARSASYADYLHFFEGMERLHREGIPVYLCTGNHDPYTMWRYDVPLLPENVHVFDTSAPSYYVHMRDGEPLCLLAGRSYYNQTWPVDRSIVEGITRADMERVLSADCPDAPKAPFSVGITHTGLSLDPYKAPSDPDDLLERGVDYWACGHIHGRYYYPSEQEPRIVFPGDIQGRDIKEQGRRGCFLVTLEEGKAPKLEDVPTATVAFEILDVDVSECSTLAEMERRIEQAMFRENGLAGCEEMVVRITLEGTTELHGLLVSPDVVEDMRRRINANYPVFYCDALVNHTKAPERNDNARPNAAFLDCVTGIVEEQAAKSGEVVSYVQAEFVKRGLDAPATLAKRIDALREEAQQLIEDLLEAEDEVEANPSNAFVEVERRISVGSARTGASEDSIAYLDDLAERYRGDIVDAKTKLEQQKQAHRERYELEQACSDSASRIEVLEEQLDELKFQKRHLETCEADIDRVDVEMESVRRDLEELDAGSQVEADGIPERLLELDAATERTLKDKLDECAAEEEKATRALDLAQENASTSRAAYEALVEMGAEQESKEGAPAGRLRNIRTVQALVSVLLPVAFMAAGAGAFVHGRVIASLSITALGIGLVVLAFFLAAGALVMLFRPDEAATALETRKTNAQWVMLQDQKKLEAQLQAKQKTEERIGAYLDEAGFGSVGGSLRQARSLLDDASEARARMNVISQKRVSLEMRASSLAAERAQLVEKRAKILSQVDAPGQAEPRTVENLITRKTAQRDALLATSEKMQLRIEELDQILEKAKSDHLIDDLNMEHQIVRTKLEEGKQRMAVLFIARHLIDAGLARM